MIFHLCPFSTLYNNLRFNFQRETVFFSLRHSCTNTRMFLHLTRSSSTRPISNIFVYFSFCVCLCLSLSFLFLSLVFFLSYPFLSLSLPLLPSMPFYFYSTKFSFSHSHRIAISHALAYNVTRKKSQNVYKSCPKMITLENWVNLL